MDPMISKDKRFAQLRKHLSRGHQLASVAARSVAQLHQILIILFASSYVDKPLVESVEYKSNMRRNLLMKITSSDQICRNIIRMSSNAFLTLCERLRDSGLVIDNKNSCVEEKVAKFLYLIAHNVKNRELCLFFHRGPRSISCHFHEVLKAIISIHNQFIKQPDGETTPPEISNTSRFYPYLKDCLGAIDGTHVRVRVPSRDAPRFRGRKDWPTTNVLAACSFDMKFTYVLPGWEGTASDSRILKDSLTRSDNLKIPEGKYYLGDAGFGIKSYLLTPYRGVRYHLKEYSKRSPQNASELFNHRHASARNIIERAFGVLKKRFPIIASGTEPSYSLRTQIQIILACCVLHNYLMGVDPDTSMIDEVDQEIANALSSEALGIDRQDADARKGMIMRDALASAMWDDYVL